MKFVNDYPRGVAENNSVSIVIQPRPAIKGLESRAGDIWKYGSEVRRVLDNAYVTICFYECCAVCHDARSRRIRILYRPPHEIYRFCTVIEEFDPLRVAGQRSVHDFVDDNLG